MSRYIDADEVKKALLQLQEDDFEMYGGVYIPEGFDGERAAATIDAIPTADVEKVRHGEWLPSPDGINPIRCNRCDAPAPYVFVSNAQGGTEMIRYKFNFCPYCGAKMDGGKNDTRRSK